jgi:hypothetical protein
MPQVEVKTRFRRNGRRDPEVVLDILFVPRGSGNRAYAVKLARMFRNHEVIGPHVREVKAGSSRVTVSLIASIKLMGIILRWQNSPEGREDIAAVLGVPAA